jgi:DNA-binding CsgD family transcriptional regulator
MLATEVTVPEIARQLQVSVNTVRKQVVTLREKFGSDSRAELIRKARAYGAIP